LVLEFYRREFDLTKQNWNYREFHWLRFTYANHYGKLKILGRRTKNKNPKVTTYCLQGNINASGRPNTLDPYTGDSRA